MGDIVLGTQLFQPICAAATGGNDNVVGIDDVLVRTVGAGNDSALAERAFGTLDRNLTNLVMILAEKHLSYLLPKIYDEYSSLYDESRGIERVEVISAVPLSESQSKSLVSRLEKLCEKTVKLHCTVDPSVLGGMKVRYSGIQLDGTVKARLDSFRESLKNIVI